MNVKGRKNAVSPAVYPAGLAVLFLLLLSVRKDLRMSETSFGDVIKQEAAQQLSEELTGRFVPVLSFVWQGQQENRLMEKRVESLMPLYGFCRRQMEKTSARGTERENYLSLEDILLAEARETENNTEDTDPFSGEEVQRKTTLQQEQTADNTMQELLKAENEAALRMNMEPSSSSFVRHGVQNEVDIRALGNYETLVENFYTIDKNTMAGSDQLDVTKLMGKDLRITKEGEGPQILIYHTHSQEAFADSVPGDVNTTIVGVGEYLSEILRTEYGYRVLHHTEQYDVEVRDDAYSKALPDIERVLEENPSIQVIIDLHRDQMPEDTKLVMDLDGRPTARFMLFNGLSRTRKTGNIAYLYNENQEENLAFSFQLQLKATECYPGLTRKIYLKGYRYNMHLCPRTALIELGAQNNTVEEAMNACAPLAHILDMVLSGTR